MAHKVPSLSPYVYCLNSPLNRFDRDGKEAWPEVIRSAGQLSLAIIGFVGGVSGMITAIPEEEEEILNPWYDPTIWREYDSSLY